MSSTSPTDQSASAASGFQTLSKLREFPLINSAWTQSSGLYNRVKESSPLVGSALSTAESTVTLAAVHATSYPTVQRFQAPLARVDETLARGLTCLEQRVPLVKAEPAVLYEGARSCVNYISGRVADVRQNVTVRSLKDLAKEKANEVLNSRYGNIAFQGFSNSTFVAEQLIDHYLPLSNEVQDRDAAAYQEILALSSDQDRLLFTLQTLGRIAGKLKRGVALSVRQLPAQAIDMLNRTGLMIHLASYLALVNQHLASQQSQPQRTS